VRPLVAIGVWNFALAGGVLLLWLLYANPAFNATPANIVGLVTAKPRTEDYVPLFPWLAATLTGVGLATLWRRRDFRLTATAERLNAAPQRLLTWLGRRPLTVYLLHQPILLGALWLLKTLA
jgi:uncharacterized membrane protein